MIRIVWFKVRRITNLIWEWMRERNTLRKALIERKITVHSRVKSNFCLTVGRNAELLQFCVTSLCDWSRNLTLLSQPIRSKTEGFTLSCYWLMIGPWDFLGFGFCDTRSKTAPRELTSVYEHQAIRKTVTPRDRMFSVTGYWPTCWRFMHNNWLLTFYTCGGDRLSVWK